MPAIEEIAKTIDGWNIKTYSTQFSGYEHHVCERAADNWGAIFKSLDAAKKDLSNRRAAAVQDLFAKVTNG